MILIRISGHSGAGKSRLLAALEKTNLKFKKTVLYTSRTPRPNEVQGIDYYFLKKEEIDNLPQEHFFIGPVREMLQAVDLNQLESDLKDNHIVIIEIYHELWLNLKKVLINRLKNNKLKIVSFFLTAINPNILKNKSKEVSSKIIKKEVKKILKWRKMDLPEKIKSRSESAINEVLSAFDPAGLYDEIIFSAPEGPDEKDEWTKEDRPIGQAEEALNEFLSHIKFLLIT